MSEEKKTPEKKAEPGKGAKILNWFKTLPQRIVKPFRNMYYELKKVTWPSKERLISYSTIVLCFMLVMGVVIGLLDMGASAGVRALVSATSGTTAAAAVEEVPAETAETATEVTEEAAEAAAEAPTEAAETATEAATEAAGTVEETAEAAEAATDTAETPAEEASEGK